MQTAGIITEKEDEKEEGSKEERSKKRMTYLKKYRDLSFEGKWSRGFLNREGNFKSCNDSGRWSRGWTKF